MGGTAFRAKALPDRSLGVELAQALVGAHEAGLVLDRRRMTEGRMAATERDKLEALAAHLRPTGEPPALFLFSRSGFEEPLLEAAANDPRLRLVTPEEMWGSKGTSRSGGPWPG